MDDDDAVLIMMPLAGLGRNLREIILRDEHIGVLVDWGDISFVILILVIDDLQRLNMLFETLDAQDTRRHIPSDLFLFI